MIGCVKYYFAYAYLGLLIAVAIPLAAVRALPCDSVAGHSPKIFQHARLADLEAASACPAEGKNTGAANAYIFSGASFSVLTISRP